MLGLGLFSFRDTKELWVFLELSTLESCADSQAVPGESLGTWSPKGKPQQGAAHGCPLSPGSLSQAAQHTGTIKGTHAALDVKSWISHSTPGSEHDPKPRPRSNRAEVKVIPQTVTKAPHP